MYLKNNIEQINKDIEAACLRAGRSRDEVQLVAVTKTIDEAIINDSLKYGVTDIGENKVQEIQRKFENIDDGIRWHLIGHLQRNKVKYIIDKVDMIHSVDSLRLAEEIDKRAEQIDRTMDILIQLNISHEESKFGININELKDMIVKIDKLENVRVKGLMTMAPFFEEPEEAREIFRKMKEIFEELKYNDYNHVEMKHLSMGMTNDYIVAIEEGATLVRVGTGIYGKRDYSR